MVIGKMLVYLPYLNSIPERSEIVIVKFIAKINPKIAIYIGNKKKNTRSSDSSCIIPKKKLSLIKFIREGAVTRVNIPNRRRSYLDLNLA